MKVGDLVSVVQKLGCDMPPRLRDRGLGVVVGVTESEPLHFPSVGLVQVSDEVEVALATGATEVFFPESLEVISESR